MKKKRAVKKKAKPSARTLKKEIEKEREIEIWFWIILFLIIIGLVLSILRAI
ncbi:hypothetical protein KY330_01315 [Candidatus Woesearchaeota archaeon]|nr:hypothetical protein [Candidatus Woesearchaeota archaeon]